MERDIVKPPSVGTGVRRVPFVKGAGVFFPPQHFPGSVSNSLSEQRQDISHRNTTGACRAKDQCSGARAGTEGRREGGKGKNGGREGGSDGKGERGARKRRWKCGVDRKSEEEGRRERRVCVWEREKDHGGVRGSGVCSSTSGLSM